MSEWLGGFFMAGKKYVKTELQSQSQRWLGEGEAVTMVLITNHD
jgi:hypothetical protein